MEEWYDIKVGDFFVEIKDASNCFWKERKIVIHDPAKEITAGKIVDIVEYLYYEGFIEDRRTQVEVKV